MDRLAPAPSATPPAARQRPRRDAKICDVRTASASSRTCSGPVRSSVDLSLAQPHADAKGQRSLLAFRRGERVLVSQTPARKSLLTSSLRQSSICVAQVFCVRTQRLCCGCDAYEGAATVAVDGALMIVVKKLKPKLVGFS